jgi:hypothetical protein
MITLAHTWTVVAHTTPRQTQRRTLLVPLATISVIVGIVSWFAYGQADGAMTMLKSFLSGNRFSAADIEMLRILSAAFAPSIVGLLLAFFGAGLQDDAKQ